jgi:hypothetical protein
MLGRYAVKSGTMTGDRGAFRDARHVSQRFQKRRTNCMLLPSATLFAAEKSS